MERKKLASKSFQQKIVDFLKENPSKSFTAKEILEQANKRWGESKTDGSISGTLVVLQRGGWVVKSDDYPSRYSYREESSDTPTADESEINRQSTEDKASQNPFLQDLSNRIKDITSKIADIDGRLEVLQRERSILQGQLKFAEELIETAQAATK